MLEHRWLQRQASISNVQLYKQGKAVGTACTFDINSEGIGVECGDLELHEGEIIEIDLTGCSVPEGIDHHVRCLVIHTEKNHCGLMFLDSEEDEE